MESIIKKIYDKELGYKESVPKDVDYQEARNEYIMAYEALEKTLNEEQKNMLSELFLCEGGVQSSLEYLFFKDGFSARIKLGIELCEKES